MGRQADLCPRAGALWSCDSTRCSDFRGDDIAKERYPNVFQNRHSSDASGLSHFSSESSPGSVTPAPRGRSADIDYLQDFTSESATAIESDTRGDAAEPNPSGVGPGSDPACRPRGVRPRSDLAARAAAMLLLGAGLLFWVEAVAERKGSDRPRTILREIDSLAVPVVTSAGASARLARSGLDRIAGSRTVDPRPIAGARPAIR